MVTMNSDALKNHITNPARPYLFELVIPDPGGGDSELWRMRGQSAVIPGRSFTKHHVDFKATGGVEYAGKERYGHRWETTLIESEDRETFNAFYTWMQEVLHNKTGIGAGDTVIKRDLYITLINTDGTVGDKIKIIGCFPEEVPDTPLDMGSDDILRYTCAFSYDRWERG